MCDGEGTIVLCNYARGGNFVGIKPYIHGDQCANCLPPWGSCNDGLCSMNDGSSLFPSKMTILLFIFIILQAFV